MTSAKTDGQVLLTYAIFNSPDDFPGKFVLRVFECRAGTVDARQDCIVGDTLDEVRSHLPHGLMPFERLRGDVPALVETWI